MVRVNVSRRTRGQVGDLAMGWGQGAGEMMPRGCRDAAKGGEEKDCKDVKRGVQGADYAIQSEQGKYEQRGQRIFFMLGRLI